MGLELKALLHKVKDHVGDLEVLRKVRFRHAVPEGAKWYISADFHRDREAEVESTPAAPASAHEHISEFIAFVGREDIIGAAHHLGQILDLHVRVAVALLPGGVLRLSMSDLPENIAALSEELLAIDAKGLRMRAVWPFDAACVALLQTLFRRGEQPGRRTFLSAFHAKNFGADIHFVQDVEFAQSRFAEDGMQAPVLVRNLALGGLDYLEFFRGKYCPHPFGDFEVRSDGEVFVCCPSFLPFSIGSIYRAQSPDELTSSPILEKLKDSILKQDFRYCRWNQCNKIKNGLPDRPAQAKTEYVPVDFRLSYDPTCNLWCPSCRKEQIVAKGEQREKILRLTDETILPLLKSAHSCMMNGYGDVFASKACRRILEVTSSAEFPDLKFEFITNGVLFTRSEWEKFPNIHNMVNSIRVSIDAARKETYDKVRLGGDWDVLMDNLEFMASLRRQGAIRKFWLSMVVQDSNYEEMADFALMARRLDCDAVIFEPIMNWNTFSPEQFTGKAVHYGSHPLHGRYRHELDRMHAALGRANEEARRHCEMVGATFRNTSASVNF